MTTNELRACPFCGKKRHLRFEPFEGSTDTGIVVCICGASYTAIEQGADWNTRPIEDKLNKRIAELEEKQRWRVVADGELPEVYRDEDGDFIPFLVCEGDGGNPFKAMYNGINWWAGIFVPDITHWMPMPSLPEECEK